MAEGRSEGDKICPALTETFVTLPKFLNPYASPEGSKCSAPNVKSKKSEQTIQEVLAFCDFWYQKGITKLGDHEF